MDTLKELVELAQGSDFGEKLAAYCSGAADKARETALIQQGKSYAYAEMAAILEGRVQFDESQGEYNG